MKTSREVSNYIATFPAETQAKLEQLRELIQKAAPMAEEGWSYMMPAYSWEGPLVYFAGYKKHIGFYPTSSGIAAFQKEIAAYKSSKGAVQFPLDKPLPLALITKMVKHRIEVNQAKAEAKNSKKSKEGFMDSLSAPARRALEGAGIKTLRQLSKHSKDSLLQLHGFGPASIPVLQKALKEAGLSFKS
jgi:uncharacterized protein YdhG (YjbR/CyaY superfamily)